MANGQHQSLRVLLLIRNNLSCYINEILESGNSYFGRDGDSLPVRKDIIVEQ